MVSSTSFHSVDHAIYQALFSHTMTATLQGQKTMLSLWKRQQGRGARGEAMTTTTGWHAHHQVWRSLGGRDALDNRVLLHPTCHHQVHHASGSTCAPHPLTRVFGKA